MSTLRSAALLTTGIALAVGLMPVAAQAAPRSTTAAVAAAGVAVQNGPSTVRWHACAAASLKAAGGQCSTVSVPLDYAHPSGAQIKIAVSRILHTVPASQYQGVMLVNPGGPGGSGLTLSRLGSFVPNHAGDYYDWIGFDPRGVGSSVPAVSCDPNYFGFDRPDYTPTSPAVEAAWLAKAKGYAQDCARRNGPILQHLTTVDTVRDMDRIRAALGARQINYYGFSYGTYLGQVYGTLYPGRVRRMVLDSNVDPRKVWYSANLSQDIAFERVINIWFGWVARYDSVYHLGTTQAAVKKLWYDTRAALVARPAGGKIGGSEWTDIFLPAGYTQFAWTDLAETFAGYLQHNDVANLVQHYIAANGLGDDNGYAIYDAVQCTDVQWPTSWATWKRDNTNLAARAPFETWANAWFNAPCLYWPAPAHTPVSVDGSKVASVLLIDETLDAATPFGGSLAVRSLFPNSSLIALPGGTSHANSLDGDACLDNQIAAYLATGVRPARKPGDRADATCAPLPQPVPVGAAAAASPALTGSASLRPQLVSPARRP